MAGRYGKKAGEKVEKVMREYKHGKLKSGRSGKQVESRKQAIAIGLSEARKEGANVPPPEARKQDGRRRARATSKPRSPRASKTAGRREPRKAPSKKR